MPTAYRIEVCPNNRATCQNTECKNEGVKIFRDELRFGSLVEIQEHQSWKYKHWGCVSPLQLEKWWHELAEENLSLVDGYEELPPHLKEKVKRALERGHVDDDEWKGDIEKNRPGQKGFRNPTPKQKKKKDVADVTDADEFTKSPSKTTSKKRSRPAKAEDDDVDDEAPKKKAKGRPKKAKAEDMDVADDAPKKAKGRTKKAKVEDTDVADDAPPKKTKGSSKKVKAEDTDAANDATSKKRGRPKKQVDTDDTAEPTKKRGRPKKQAAVDDGDTEVSGKKRGRPKKVKEVDADDGKPVKKRGRPKQKRDGNSNVSAPKELVTPEMGLNEVVQEDNDPVADTTPTLNPVLQDLSTTNDLQPTNGVSDHEDQTVLA